MFFTKIYEKLDKILTDLQEALRQKSADLETTIAGLKQFTREELNRYEEKIKNIDDSLKKMNDLYEKHHIDVLEKMNKAGELIISYEDFYISTINELDDVFRFVETLSKRPVISSDPDYANFIRAVQAMESVISKYSSLGEKISQSKKESDSLNNK